MKKTITTVVCAALLCFGLSVFAVDIMPIDQIKIGMQGVAKTVVYGSRIDEFNVEAPKTFINIVGDNKINIVE